MSKGFLILAHNTSDVNYVDQAYALALSIKYSQKTFSKISIVTNNRVSKKYRAVFDKVIKIPWIDQTVTPASRYKCEHRWKLYHVSPYTETIVLDTDMLVLEDITKWWHYCNNYDIKFCSKIKSYKLEPITDTVNRKHFIVNNLTNPYVALHYFKKSQVAYEFYRVLEFVCNNWQWCYDKFAPNLYQDYLSMDLAVAIAIEITGQFQAVNDICSPLEFIHMKPNIQQWHSVPAKWQDVVPVILNFKGELVVGNIKQSKIFHYVEKDFLTAQLILRLEDVANGK